MSKNKRNYPHKIDRHRQRLIEDGVKEADLAELIDSYKDIPGQGIITNAIEKTKKHLRNTLTSNKEY